VDGVDPHRHCKVCSKPCSLDAEVCSKACRRTYDERRRTRQQYTYVMYALMAFVVLVFLLNYLRI
jgi:predicted nucleic acid-binding Zn ribbon protein